MALILPTWFRQLPHEEQHRLISEANAPLTPEEVEKKHAGVSNVQLKEAVEAAAKEIAAARERFCRDAVKAELQKQKAPRWVYRGGKAACEWLQTRGYRFVQYQNDPLRFEFRRGDTILAVMQVELKGAADAPA